jgi:hypothetical protein
MRSPNWPTPYDLARCPELAILAVLDDALHLTIRALVASYPQLDSDEVPSWRVDRSRPFLLARTIISLAQSLSAQIERYQPMLASDPPDVPPDEHQDIPF